ncbi:MAG: YigZ family protein [Selenomonadaceae bacterium]|nr:YigZ family protein [Selenomonadaceae bacterium]
MKNYKTVADGEIFSAEYEVKKSVFIAHVKHVESEESAREFVQQVRKKYFDATHNCSAWILGEGGNLQKSNDDGEPGGTAGNPILETIKKNDLTNAAVVVTRYFGGIKLGAGGLIRAYSHTAALGLDAAKIIRMTPFQRIALTLEYNFLAQVENFLRKKNIAVESSDYTDVVTLNILILPAQVDDFLTELTDLTAANFLHELKEEILLPLTVTD